MSLPADQRAHYLAITARVLADQVRDCNLPGEASARIFELIEQIHESARVLRDELSLCGSIAPLCRPPIDRTIKVFWQTSAEFPLATTAALAPFDDKVVPFRRRAS